MWLPAFVKNFRGSQLVIQLEQSVNFERLKTMYNGNLSKILVRIEFVDPRQARPKQRALFFALIGDIWNWSGQPTEDVKEYFYNQYAIKTCGKNISLANDTESTVTDANKLLEMVIDFMFEWQVPFKNGYELLPRNESYFLFLCCKYRMCMECGKHADIHHLDTIGMGGNRTRVDHSKRYVMALCRSHHREIEQIGARRFGHKYHLPITGIKLDIETLRKIHVAGNYQEKSDDHEVRNR